MPLKARYLYVTAELARAGEVASDELAGFTERHRVRLEPVFGGMEGIATLAPSAAYEGIVIEAAGAVVGRAALLLGRAWIRVGRRAFVYWPKESAAEVLDDLRIASYWRVLLASVAFHASLPVLRRLGPLRQWLLPPGLGSLEASLVNRDNWVRLATDGLDELLRDPRPTPLRNSALENGRWAVRGHGTYLRTDYWVRITSGGSYGHTCHVANQLAKVSEEFTAFMAHPFDLMQEMGLRQIKVVPPYEESSERALIVANLHYYARLKAVFEVIRPAYIYERLVLGNCAGARLSRELGIPYLVEYNGSEISMNRSFGAGGYEHEPILLKIEDAAFRQATVISVISAHVRDSLLVRGVPSDRIIVNPNGVDTDVYAPLPPEKKCMLRESLGYGPDDCVIGFIATFGGWHGIDVLAAALPIICERAPNAKFLLIGDGNKKPLIDETIARHRLWNRVRCTGRVPQQEGAHLLKACDLYVSPHDSHMVDSPFFGSPTKVFEYMGLGGGIVASDLEQIGEVLSPALSPPDLSDPPPVVSGERAVLCRPGEVEEFAAAVAYLCANPAVAGALGANARMAAISEYSWAHHVQRLLDFAAKQGIAAAGTPASAEAPRSAGIATGDAYKDEVQNQWDNDPCGSQFVRNARPHTLEWFLEVERYRYGDYAPWMPGTMEFDRHRGERVLEIGGGLGTDLAQFARHGAVVTDVDLSSGHLALARENFALRGLEGVFIHLDAERLPFPDASFDVVYSNGVIHHTPNTQSLVDEIRRVLRPGGLAIVMVYAENSLHYWRDIVVWRGLVQGMHATRSIGQIMSETEELGGGDARPLVKVYTARRLRRMFAEFEQVRILKRQLRLPEIPVPLRCLSVTALERISGWNLIVKARKGN